MFCDHNAELSETEDEAEDVYVREPVNEFDAVISNYVLSKLAMTSKEEVALIAQQASRVISNVCKIGSATPQLEHKLVEIYDEVSIFFLE